MFCAFQCLRETHTVCREKKKKGNNFVDRWTVRRIMRVRNSQNDVWTCIKEMKNWFCSFVKIISVLISAKTLLCGCVFVHMCVWMYSYVCVRVNFLGDYLFKTPTYFYVPFLCKTSHIKNQYFLWTCHDHCTPFWSYTILPYIRKTKTVFFKHGQCLIFLFFIVTFFQNE